MAYSVQQWYDAQGAELYGNPHPSSLSFRTVTQAEAHAREHMTSGVERVEIVECAPGFGGPCVHGVKRVVKGIANPRYTPPSEAR